MICGWTWVTNGSAERPRCGSGDHGEPSENAVFGTNEAMKAERGRQRSKHFPDWVRLVGHWDPTGKYRPFRRVEQEFPTTRIQQKDTRQRNRQRTNTTRKPGTTRQKNKRVI
jgi:hypothetical protein